MAGAAIDGKVEVRTLSRRWVDANDGWCYGHAPSDPGRDPRAPHPAGPRAVHVVDLGHGPLVHGRDGHAQRGEPLPFDVLLLSAGLVLHLSAPDLLVTRFRTP